MKTYISLSLLVLFFLVFSTGCGSRPVGVVDGQDGGVPRDGATGTDGGDRPDGSPKLFGHVMVFHGEDDRDDDEWLTLLTMFYVAPYDPTELLYQEYGLVDTLLTPDGAPCEVYLSSELHPYPKPVPAPPDQGNGGIITVRTGEGGYPLRAVFDGEAYTVDNRSSRDQNLPAWLVSGGQSLLVEGAGSSLVEPFERSAVLAAMPAVTAPENPEDPMEMGSDGNYLFSWEAVEADEILIYLVSNMDWDESVFICRLAPGATRLRVPAMWIMDWTWGFSEVTLVYRNTLTFEVPDARVKILTQSSTLFSVSYEIVYP